MTTNPTFSLPELTPRQIAAGTLAVALVGLGFWLLYRFHQVVLILFAAVIISTAVKPVVARMQTRGLPRWLGATLIFVLMLFLIAVLAWLLVPISIDQGMAFARSLPARYAELRQAMLENANFFIWRLGVELPPELSPFIASARDQAEQATTTVIRDFRLFGVAVQALFAIGATFVLAFLWTLSGERVSRSLMLLLPADRRVAVRQFAADAEQMLGNFIVGQALLCLIVGGMALVAFLLLGLPNALLLAILVGLLEAVPLIGPIIGAIPVTLLAYSVSPTTALLAFLAVAGIQQVENQFLVPRVMKHSVGVNPLVTLLALSAFGLLFGLPGVLVAIPTAALVQLLLNRTVLANGEPAGRDLPGRDQLSVLRLQTHELVGDLRQQIRHKDEDAGPGADHLEEALESIANDLERLLAVEEQQGEMA